MDFAKKILKEYRNKADRQLITFSRTLMAWVCLILFLNYIDIFILDKKTMLIWTIISCIIYFIPTFYCDILNKHSVNGVKNFWKNFKKAVDNGA